MWWWFLFLWYSHTHVGIAKIKLIMLENTTNNLNENSIKPNNNCHSQCDDQMHYYNMSTWIKKSFSRKAHKTNESLKPFLITQWEFINGLKTSTHVVYNSNFVHHSLNRIPFLCNHLRNSTQSFMRCLTFLQNLQTSCGSCPFLGALPLDFEEES
jgi:hypothetical protein